MRSMTKLVRGELYKMWKSKTVAIMSVLLAIAIAIMGAIYANYDKDVQGMLGMVFGGDNRMTAFQLFDGSANELIEEAMGGSIDGSMEDFEAAFDKVKNDVKVKSLLVGMDPAVMKAMSESMNPQSEWFLFLSKDSPALTAQLGNVYKQFAIYGAFAPVQEQVSKNFLNNYINSDFATTQRMADLTDWLKNNGKYGRTVVEYINGLADDLYADYRTLLDAQTAYRNAEEELKDNEGYKTAYKAYADANTAYNAVYAAALVEYNEALAKFEENQDSAALAMATAKFNMTIEAARKPLDAAKSLLEMEYLATLDGVYSDVLRAFVELTNAYYDLSYFTKSSVMGTSFLLLPTGTAFVNMPYQTYKNSLDEAFGASSFADALNNYVEVADRKKSLDSVAAFKEDFLSKYDAEYEKRTVEAAPYDRISEYRTAFLGSLDSFVIAMKNSATSVFAYDSTEVRTAFDTVASNRTDAQKRLVDSYSVKDAAGNATGEKDPMLPAKSVFAKSYTGEVTREIYEKEIKPYFDDKERANIEKDAAKLNEVRGRFSNADLLLGLFEPADRGDYEGTPDYETYYAEYEQSYKSHAARVGTARDLIVNVNLYESIAANDLSDAEAKKIQGFMMSSRYALRSEVTKAQYLVENNRLASSFSAPESLGGAYGAMQFIFVLTKIVVLVFGIVLAAGMIAGEHSGGTMKLLLIRPHRRWQVLIAKFCAVLIALAAFYAINYVLTLVAGIYWGFEAVNALVIFNSKRAIIMHPAVVLLLQHLFGFLEAAIFAQIALTLSTVIKSRSGAVSVSMLVYFLSFVLSGLLSSFAWYKFVIFNNTDLSMYLSSVGPSLADMNLGLSLLIDVVYIVVFAVISLWTFAKRDAS